MDRPIVWAIAASDSSGGAGAQNDLQVFQGLGARGFSVLTGITAQNAHALLAAQAVSPELLGAQIDALLKIGTPKALKIGSIGALSLLERLAGFLEHYQGAVVLDPVLKTSSGQWLAQGDLQEHLTGLKKLLPSVDILTPNLFEAEQLVGHPIQSGADVERAGKALRSLGAKNVLIKGGHWATPGFCYDYWCGQEGRPFWLAHARCPGLNYRGTGCALSSAMAAAIALGHPFREAALVAAMYVHRGIRLAVPVSSQAAHLFHGGWPETQMDLPCLSYGPPGPLQKPFRPCSPKKIGLYPIVGSFAWVQKLAPLGLSYVQLRIKNKSGLELAHEIKRSIVLAKQYNMKLIINDHWELALRFGAYGVHLGQADLLSADLAALQKAGLRLGISTHCYEEIAHAHFHRPSYMAIGPIFATNSKPMSFSPLGTTQLSRFRRTVNCPLVAIGGIDEKKLAAVLATQVDGAAILSAITQAMAPLQSIEQLKKYF